MGPHPGSGPARGPGHAPAIRRAGPRCARWVALAATLALRPALADEPPEVEIVGDAPSAPSKNPGVAGSVIREERLRSPGLDAGDVLRTQPGIAVTETGGHGALSTASIRGATSAETPVYLAGVRLNDDVGGTADLSLVPLWLLHRVEIYRSHAPAEADRLGIGGAIFFEPRRPRRTEGAVGAMAGSFGARGLWGHVAAGDADRAALVGVRFAGAANDYGYVDDRGTRFDPSDDRQARRTNADTRTVDAWAIATTKLGDRGRADLVVNAVGREQGLPGLTLFPSARARSSQSRELAALTATLPCGDGGCTLTSTTSALFARTSYDDPLREVGLGTTALDVAGTRFEQGFSAHLPLGAGVTLTPSARASLERLAIDPSAADPLRARRVFARAAALVEWEATDLLTLRALGSGECHSTSLDGRAPWDLGQPAGGDDGALCTQLEPAGRVGAQLGDAPVALFVNAGRYARVPTLAELYGLSGAVRGNAALSSERGVSADVGVRATAPARSALAGGSIDLFAFARRADGLVAYERSGLGYVRPYNVGAARVLGLELLASYRAARWVRAELAATLLDPRDVSPDRVTANALLPYQPRLIAVPRVELSTRAPLPGVAEAKLAASYFYSASRYADAAGLVVLPAQQSLDVEGEVSLLGEHLAVRGRVANVLDQARTDLIGYPLPGRAAYLALEGRL